MALQSHRFGSTLDVNGSQRRQSEFTKPDVQLGFKEIEISFPCSSQTDLDFTRRLIKTPGLIPDDVTIQAMTPCRKDAILTTVESLKGAKKAILFSWISMSDNFRETMLGMTEDECLERVVECTKYARSLTVENPSAQDTEWTFSFGFEDFPNSRPEAALRFAEAIKNAWGPEPTKPLILGVAASVESTMPNVFADQVEYFLRNISDREKFVFSVHPHNDRGCGVASAELARLAGADRIEGCLFGNGERAGNVDLVTLALNLLTQGIDPQLDFSNLPEVRDIVEELTQIPTHPRAPYAGEFYFRAFSGAHQDAIIKGFRRHDAENNNTNSNTFHNGRPQDAWRVPYLPMDPPDIGIGYDRIIKVNSQSGKSGVAWLVMRALGLDLPLGLRMAFSKLMKRTSEAVQREITAEEIARLFLKTYNLEQTKVPLYIGSAADTPIDGNSILQDPDLVRAKNMETGPTFTTSIAKHLSRILGISVSNIELTEQDSAPKVIKQKYIVYAECTVLGFNDSFWGAAVGSNSRITQINAILSALYAGGMLKTRLETYTKISPLQGEWIEELPTRA
ncbi:hypothetical protein B7463_g7747, partial [Scytalidium lignicola]